MSRSLRSLANYTINAKFTYTNYCGLRSDKIPILVGAMSPSLCVCAVLYESLSIINLPLVHSLPARASESSNFFFVIGRAKRAPHWGVQSRFRVICIYVTRFGKIRINAATNYFCLFLLTGYMGPEDLDFQV